jgi:hypothetical protein
MLAKGEFTMRSMKTLLGFRSCRRLGMSFGLCVLLVTALGCGGDIGTDIRPAPSPTDPSSTAPTTYTAAQLNTAGAQCSAPHGPPDPVPSIDRLYAILVGVWYLCPSTAAVPFKPELSNNGTPRVGMEVTSDGHFYWLQADASGSMIRGSGLTEEGGYTFVIDNSPDTVEGLDVEMNITFGDRSFTGARPTFESGPRRLDLYGFDQYFVPMNAAR